MTDPTLYEFHGPVIKDFEEYLNRPITIQEHERNLHYRFYNHFHPYVERLVDRLIKQSVAGLQAIDTEYVKDESTGKPKVPPGKSKPDDYELYETFFDEYVPNREFVPNSEENPDPVKDLDFHSNGAYSVYNWELFYHVPITIAIHLSKNQRFEEAQYWFHYVFDPTDDSEGPTPDRFWRVKEFQTTTVEKIEEILVNLAEGKDDALVDAFKEWMNNPFRPHAVARHRSWAYMYKAVMAYLDNLIAWGDSLFRQDTGETINEATQLYILAANILGPRPQAVPKKGTVRPQTYANLRDELQYFSVVMTEMESSNLYNIIPPPGHSGNLEQLSVLQSIGTLNFCVPRNDKLLSYWDTVADRLFKIRNSLNIQGIFRQLPLFEPPIDPGLLAKATAAGLDIGAVVSGINQPLPLVRFQLLVQKAAEICQEVKSLGNNLLSAIEKEDNEALAVLRANHESIILGLAETIKYSQLQEAIKSSEGLEKSLNNSVQRYIYYERLLGKEQSEIEIPALDELDAGNLEKMRFTSKEPEVTPRNINVDIAQDSPELMTGGKKISSYEFKELKSMGAARNLQAIASTFDSIASIMALIPQFDAEGEPLGVGASTGFGGRQLSTMMSIMANIERSKADQFTFDANMAAKIGSYARREQEWEFQSNIIAGEITQTFKQLRAAQIREAIAEKDWKNHQQQIRNAEDIEHYLSGEKTKIGNKQHKKTSTQDLYTWMKREVKGLYSECFQFAFDIAKKAERALQHELGNPELSYLKFNYLAGKEGLLAGEKLYMDIKRMEMAYHDLNQREYEITKHVNLLQVNPLALIQLRATGSCTVQLPEELFDLDCPGHYFRRIKSIAVSIPCVAGPYTSVNCTLTLLKSSIRKSSLLSGSDYERSDANDTRFSDYFGSLQSIVTSSGQNDSGLFETNLHDERYLPFEGSGAISEWQLQLPANPSEEQPQQFDYDTISDVVLHLRYTAREGGQLLRSGAIDNLSIKIDEANTIGSVRLFSIRHEFPTEWANFKNIKIEGAIKTATLSLEIREEHYPFWSQGKDRLGAIKKFEIIAKTGEDTTINKASGEGTGEGTGTETGAETGAETSVEIGTLSEGAFGKNFRSCELESENIPLSAPEGKLSLSFSDNSMEDLWLAVEWGKASK